MRLKKVKLPRIRTLKAKTFRKLKERYEDWQTVSDRDGIFAALFFLSQRYKVHMPSFVINPKGCDLQGEGKDYDVGAYYSPSNERIHFRYVRPTLREIVHEFVHHVQNVRGADFDGFTNPQFVEHGKRPIEQAPIRITKNYLKTLKSKEYLAEMRVKIN
jgi:hypothetical protein